MLENGVQKSCWGVAGWAVAAAAGILFLVWISGGEQAIAIASGS